jgi:hypothetical protein
VVGVNVMEEKEIYIDSLEIANHLWGKLVAKGYTPSADEIFDLADIFFDYLVEKSVVEDVVDYEEEE